MLFFVPFSLMLSSLLKVPNDIRHKEKVSVFLYINIVMAFSLGFCYIVMLCDIIGDDKTLI